MLHYDRSRQRSVTKGAICCLYVCSKNGARLFYVCATKDLLVCLYVCATKGSLLFLCMCDKGCTENKAFHQVARSFMILHWNLA